MCSANEDGTFKYKLKLKEDQGKDLQTTRKITLLKFNLVIGRNRVLEYKECLCLITLSNLLPEYLKYYAISHSQNSEKTTQPYATPGEASDTGFSETLAQNTDTHTPDRAEGSEITERSEKAETRSRTMTEKGFKFRSALKENSAKTAN